MNRSSGKVIPNLSFGVDKDTAVTNAEEDRGSRIHISQENAETAIL